MKKIAKSNDIFYYIIEFILIAFDVFLRVFFNKLSENISSNRLAQIARTNFLKEIDSNNLGMIKIFGIHKKLYDKFNNLLKKLNIEKENKLYDYSLEIPEITKASWESAIDNSGLIYLKNEKIILLSKCYEIKELLKSFNQKFINILSEILFVCSKNKLIKKNIEINIRLMITSNTSNNLT